MLKFLLLSVVVLSSISSYAQLTSDNVSELRKELLRLVNEERVKNGITPLQFDPKLEKAAIAHSKYMVKKKLLSHEENGGAKKPEDRVRRAKGTEFESIGENILACIPQEFPMKTKDIRELAVELFLQWKNSPPHYANMISSEYTFTDFGFATDLKTKQVYATEVFARKGIQIPDQLSKNAFGIRKGTDKDCDLLLGNKSNIVVNLGNALSIEENEVVLYYHSLDLVKELIDQPNDGIAIDLVLHDQFACGKPNTLDMSPVYDGVLLPPVYRDELLAGNRAKSEYRLISPVARIPEAYSEVDYSISLIVIQNGMECSYTIPIEIPSETYRLSDVEPILFDPQNTELVRSGIVHSIEVPFDFPRNVTSGIRQISMPPADGPIQAVDIVSFSSVEGKSSDNERLHNERAKFILQDLKKQYRFEDDAVRMNTMENWPKMRFQLTYFDMDSLLGQSNDSIKTFLRLHPSDFWDSLLFTQRRSSAYLHIQGTPGGTATRQELLNMNLRTAIIVQNDQLANKALFELYREPSADLSILFEPMVFQALKTNAQLIQNASALLSKFADSLLYERTEFLYSWMNRLEQLTPETRHNLINLYTKTAVLLMDDWDLSSQRLAKVIHPSTFYETANALNNQLLLLNYHLAAIEYYGQVNDGEMISHSFDFIVAHFKKERLPAKEEVDLVLFFNRWSQYHLTNELLFPHMDNPDFSEDAAFILLCTTFAYQEDISTEQLEHIMERAYQLNPDLWCAFLLSNFQLRRSSFVKNTSCRNCGF